MFANVALKKPSSPTVYANRHHLKVSKMSPSCRPNAIGEYLIKNRGPEHRIRSTPMSHRRGPGVPPPGAPPV
jgi:hypothetical protein